MGNPNITTQKQKYKSATRPDKSQLRDYLSWSNSRAVRLLSSLIEYSHMKRADVESEIGYAKGYLNKLLSGRIEIRLEHVTAVCKLLEFPICLFYQIVYEDETINYDELFDNALVKRMKGFLILIFGTEAEKLAKALGYEEPVHRKGDYSVLP
jgi:transcriptional regulator with XRE-family HTH domain